MALEHGPVPAPGVGGGEIMATGADLFHRVEADIVLARRHGMKYFGETLKNLDTDDEFLI